LGAQALAIVGITATYSFNPRGGADITLINSNGNLLAKFNTRDSGITQTGLALPSVTPLLVLLAATGVSVLWVARRRVAGWRQS
jgi:hypothetical protein